MLMFFPQSGNFFYVFLCLPLMLYASSLSTFFIKRKPVLSHDLRSLPRNPPDWTALDS